MSFSYIYAMVKLFIAGVFEFFGQEDYIVGLCGWSIVAQVPTKLSDMPDVSLQSTSYWFLRCSAD